MERNKIIETIVQKMSKMDIQPRMKLLAFILQEQPSLEQQLVGLPSIYIASDVLPDGTLELIHKKIIELAIL